MKSKYNNEPLIWLVENAQKNNEWALEELIRREQKNIYTTLRYLNVPSDEIMDLTQEILVKITKNIKNLKNPITFKVWANQIATRHFYDHLRRKKKFMEKIKIVCDASENEQKKNEIPDYNSNPVKNALSGELDHIIKKSINKLPEPFKIAIIMRELQGLSYDEIAVATNSSVGTVKSRIARARGKLQEYIKPYIC